MEKGINTENGEKGEEGPKRTKRRPKGDQKEKKGPKMKSGGIHSVSPASQPSQSEGIKHYGDTR